MVKPTVTVAIKLVGLEDVTRQLEAVFPPRSQGRQFSKEAFLLVAKGLNPFNQPQKPTDGDKKKKKKKKVTYSLKNVETWRYATLKELEDAAKRGTQNAD